MQPKFPLKTLLVIVALLVAPFAAVSQPSPAMPYAYAVAVTTSSGTAVAANSARKYIAFCNPNDSVKVAVCPTAGRSGAISCSVNGAGSVTLLPYSCQGFGGIGGTPSVPTGWNAVGSGSGALTVFEWE